MKRILTTLSQKWPEYLLEILVITIGILGAYGLNNWNESRKDREKEKSYLAAINKEFEENKLQFERVTKIHQNALNSIEGILSEYEKDQPNVDSMMIYQKYAWLAFTFDPSQSSIRSLVNTSSLEVIQDQELRQLLISWSDLVKDYQEDEILLEKYLRSRIFPHIEKIFDLKAHREGRVFFPKKLDMETVNIFLQRIYHLKYILENNVDNTQSENENVRFAIERVIELSKQVK